MAKKVLFILKSNDGSKKKGIDNLFGMEIDPTAKPEEGGPLAAANPFGATNSGMMEGMTEEMQE